ncbi:MAG: hypothetical protein ABFR35_10780, partial [Thermodesulfobacteriota bacterium]
WLVAEASDGSFWGTGFLMRRTASQPGHLNLTTSDKILSGSNLSFALHFGQIIFFLAAIFCRAVFYFFSLLFIE